MKPATKKMIIISSIAFIIYFTLGCVFSYFQDSTSLENLFFGADTPRVIIDLSFRIENHYRTIVHPLFIIFFQPIIYFFSLILTNKLISIIFLQSILNGISIGMINNLLDKITSNKILSYLLTAIMAISFSQIVFSATIETYSFAQFFLILLIYVTYSKSGKKLNQKDLFFLLALGVVSLGITITNYFVYFLATIYLSMKMPNCKKSEKIKNLLILNIIPISLSVMLSELQAVFFPNSGLFFKDNLNSFLNGTSEELTYIEPISFNSIINQIKTVLGYSFIAPKVAFAIIEGLNVLSFSTFYTIEKFFILLIMLLLIILVIKFIYVNRKKLKEHQFVYFLIIIFLFNFILHLFYGNSESFLYINHYQFMFILIIGYLIKNSIKTINKKLYILLIFIFLIELIFNILGTVKIFNLVASITSTNSFIPVIGYIYIIPIILILIMLKFKHKKIGLFISTICLILVNLLITNIACYKVESYIFPEYKEKYNKYIEQITQLKSNLSIQEIYKSENQIYFFGMGNRRKLIYAQGKLYDLTSGEELLNEKITKDMVIPNDYKVVLENNDGEKIIIYENEVGIYLEKDNKKTTLYESEDKINLPAFTNHKYSEILKVLHQEILFNIEESIMKPNILVYNDGWYRDAFIGAMVLEKTNNVFLIKDWVDNINSIYDYQNKMPETDNLGELLYLIYITKSDNKILDEIIEEINKIKKDNNISYLVGYTDGAILSYYPTAIAKFALEKLEIENDLKLPENDAYTKLAWFYNKSIVNEVTDSIDYPYLGWANYHYNKKDVTLYICNSLYPLSYEKNGTYANYNNMPNLLNGFKKANISPTHIWDAAEKFLLIYEL